MIRMNLASTRMLWALCVAVTGLAVALFAVVSKADSGGESWRLVQQPTQFQTEIPATWTVILPLPYWKQQEAVEKGTEAPSSAFPQFGAASSAGGTKSDPNSEMMLVVFAEHRQGDTLNLTDVAEAWIARFNQGDFADLHGEQAEGLWVFTTTGRAFDRARGKEVSVSLAVAGKDRNGIGDAWVLACIGPSPAPTSFDETCTRIRQSFKLLPESQGSQVLP